MAHSIREEHQASRTYRGRGQYARDVEDYKTANLYEHIAKEEDQHAREFTERGIALAKPYSAITPQIYDKDSRVLPFSGIKDEVITWQGSFGDQILAVEVRGAYTKAKTVLENALRHSSVVLSNIVTDKPLPYAGAQKNKVWWLATIDNLPVEVALVDTEMLKERELEDVFNNSEAFIKRYPLSKKYYVKIKDPGATSFSAGSIISWEEFEKEDKKVRERGEKPASVEFYGNGYVSQAVSQKICPRCGKPLHLHYFSKINEWSWGHEYSFSDFLNPQREICDYSEKAKPGDAALVADAKDIIDELARREPLTIFPWLYEKFGGEKLKDAPWEERLKIAQRICAQLDFIYNIPCKAQKHGTVEIPSDYFFKDRNYVYDAIDEITGVKHTRPWLEKEKKPATMSEFAVDSPEIIPFTIKDIGYRDKLDNAFQTAIEKAQRS